MSDLDLTEAVDRAARAYYGQAIQLAASKGYALPSWEDATDLHRHAAREMVVQMVEAAAPIIEKQVRREVEAETRCEVAAAIAANSPRKWPRGWAWPAVEAYTLAIQQAAEIARGER